MCIYTYTFLGDQDDCTDCNGALNSLLQPAFLGVQEDRPPHEVLRDNILYFSSTSDLKQSLFIGTDHAADIKLLSALVIKIKLLFPSLLSVTPDTGRKPLSKTVIRSEEQREQKELLKILLLDLHSVRMDRRVAARFVLTFLGHSTDAEGLKGTLEGRCIYVYIYVYTYIYT
jgi:hypothetical protein